MYKVIQELESNNSRLFKLPIEVGININELIASGNENTKSIGLFLYTDFFIIFQISGFMLLVAMIGAIVLAHDENYNLKRQNPLNQKILNKKDVIKLN